MTDYSPIIEMLEKADGPSWYRDADIVQALVPDAIVDSYPTAADDACVFHAQSIGIENKSSLPPYTGSLDASIALVERILRPLHPCMTIRSRAIYSGDRGPYWMYEITWPSHERQGHHYEPSIAILLAMFRALQAQETASDD